MLGMEGPLQVNYLFSKTVLGCLKIYHHCSSKGKAEKGDLQGTGYIARTLIRIQNSPHLKGTTDPEVGTVRWFHFCTSLK